MKYKKKSPTKDTTIKNSHILKLHPITLEPSIGGIGNKLKNASKNENEAAIKNMLKG